MLRDIREQHPDIQMRFWCDNKFAPQATQLMREFDDTVKVERIYSGKLRRYHHLTVWQHIIKPDVMLPNLRDAFLVGVGAVQAFGKLLVYRPDVVFIKGGFVGVPVGLAAHVLRIPIVIHDSDAHPGLANRIVSRWASAIGTGAPLHHYRYPPQKTQYVGTPVDAAFHPFTRDAQVAAKQQWGMDPARPLVVVTGGGLGAKRLNDVIMTTLPELLKDSNVILVSGVGQFNELQAIAPVDSRFKLIDFVSQGMATLLGAADIVVTRAGATSILEVAALAKPTILVPNGFLTGGHQLKNAAVYAEKDAVLVVDDTQLHQDPSLIVTAVRELLRDQPCRVQMAKTFHSFAKPQAAHDMAVMILNAAKRRKN